MVWMREHWEGIRFIGVAVVSSAVLGYRVRVRVIEAEAGLKPGGSQENDHCFGSRARAFAAADALIRRRRVRHACGVGCSGWVDTADSVVSQWAGSPPAP